MEENKKRLAGILRSKSILKGSFKLSSGKQSSYYIDARLTTLDPEGSSLIGKIFLDEIIKDENINSVGGPTLGADPIVGSVISQSWERNRPIKGFIVRKEEKKHGTGKVIEGNLTEGDEVAIVEDVVSTGGSVLKAIKIVESIGIKVKKVLVIVDREEGAEDKFNNSGYGFYSIFKISELL